MASNVKEIVIRGVLNYAKVLGAPRKHTGLAIYDKGPYWSVDVTPDANGLALIEKLDLDDKLHPKKKKEEEKVKADKDRVGTGKFMSFRHLLKRSDGTENKPLRIVDARGRKWDSDNLIGNGTVADVKVRVVDYGSDSEKGTYVQAIRILEHVPYEGAGDFEPLPEDDDYFPSEAEILADTGATGAFDVDLDDDVPF